MHTVVTRMVGLAALVLSTASGARAAGVGMDAAVKPYQTVSGISGNLNSIGSDTLNNLMTFWASTPTSTSRSRARVPAPHLPR